MQNVKIYSDGSAKGNPNGKGGYGTIVQYLNENGDIERYDEYSEGFKSATNNRMEMLGVIKGLESLKSPSNVEIITDSSYIVDCFKNNWIKSWISHKWKTSSGGEVKNTDLWVRLIMAMGPHNVTYTWVKGHNGHPENERCDKLATTAADNA